MKILFLIKLVLCLTIMMASSSYGKNVFIDESKVWTVDDFTNFKPLNLDQEALSEYSVLAKVGHPLLENQMLFSGYANFYLDINYDVGKLPLRLPVVVNNTTSSHGVRLFQSRECVFFLSKTLTDYRIHHPKENFITPVTPFTIEYTFDPYCTDKSGDFSYSSQIGGVDTVSREEVMALLAPNKIIKTIH